VGENRVLASGVLELAIIDLAVIEKDCLVGGFKLHSFPSCVVRADQEAGEDPESDEQQGNDQFSQHRLPLRLPLAQPGAFPMVLFLGPGRAIQKPSSGLHFTITFMGSWAQPLRAARPAPLKSRGTFQRMLRAIAGASSRSLPCCPR